MKRCNRCNTRILWKSFDSWESILYSCFWMAYLIIIYTNRIFIEKSDKKIKATWLVSKVFLYKIFAFSVKSIAFRTFSSLHSHMRTHIICRNRMWGRCECIEYRKQFFSYVKLLIGLTLSAINNWFSLYRQTFDRFCWFCIWLYVIISSLIPTIQMLMAWSHLNLVWFCLVVWWRVIYILAASYLWARSCVR